LALSLQKRRDCARGRVQQHQAVAEIGDEDAAVAVGLQTVGFAIVFGEQLDPAIGRDAENPSPGDIDHKEVAGAVKRGTFEKTVGRRAAALHIDPAVAAAADAEFVISPGFNESDGFSEEPNTASLDPIRRQICHTFGAGIPVPVLPKIGTF